MAERPPRLTPRMTHTMRRAARMARERDHDYIGTEHVLLALLEDTDGIAGGVAMRLEVSESFARASSPSWTAPDTRHHRADRQATHPNRLITASIYRRV